MSFAPVSGLRLEDLDGFEYIRDTARLEEKCREWLQADALAIDTEFARFDTYYPDLGLIQIADDVSTWLIDPLTLDISCLKALLSAEHVTKVLHACSEDLEVFQHHLGVLPMPLFDTQVAAAFLGQGFSLSYQALVSANLDLEVPKDETRSDWMQRPLTDAQCRYAALDVTCLIKVYRHQVEGLTASGRLAWAQEDCRLLLNMPMVAADPEDYYLRVSSAWKMSRKELSVLKTLCAWREVEARKNNKPRNRIIDEKALVSVARGRPRDKRDLGQLGLSPRQVRLYGADVLLMAQEARHMPEKDCPPLIVKPSTGEGSVGVKSLKQLVASRAAELEIPPESLLRKKQLDEFLANREADGSHRLTPLLQGWRREIIGEPLLAALDASA